MNSNKEKTISVRLDGVASTKLEELKAARGIESTSEVIRLSLLNTRILNIGNSGNLCEEIYKIRKKLDEEDFSFELAGKVDALCQSIYDALQKTEN